MIKLTFEQQATDGAFLHAFLITGILKTICLSNKQVFLKIVWKVKKKITIGRYIINERGYFFNSSWFILYIYRNMNINK